MVRLLVWVGLLGLVVGCCHADVNIMERSKGRLLAKSYSSERKCATDKAKEEARKYCKAKGRRMVLLDLDTKYQGVDKNLKGVAEGVGMATGKFINMDSTDDYNVNMMFRCK